MFANTAGAFAVEVFTNTSWVFTNTGRLFTGGLFANTCGASVFAAPG
ncbi:hypothetical protein [Streptomyces diastaticus]